MEPVKPAVPTGQFNVTPFDKSAAKVTAQRVPSDPIVAGIPQGVFYLTTKAAEGQNLCLESSPITLRKRGSHLEMHWKAIPVSDGYFHLTSKYLENRNLVLEAGDGTGALMVERRAYGTMWKAMPAGEGCYHLTPRTFEAAGKVLDGNINEAQGADARFRAPFMVDKASAGPSTLWKFIPVEP